MTQIEKLIELLGKCKVGDTIYVIGESKIKEATVNEIIVGYGEEITVAYAQACDFDSEDSGGCGCEFIHADAFGKTVFLTQEEAEKALAERMKNDG
jgi:hypothetical protein